jgi:hypothetical protein
MNTTRRDFFKTSGKALALATAATVPAIARADDADLERLGADFAKAHAALHEAWAGLAAIKAAIPYKYTYDVVEMAMEGGRDPLPFRALDADEINARADSAQRDLNNIPDANMHRIWRWGKPFPVPARMRLPETPADEIRAWYRGQWEVLRRECLARFKAVQRERLQYLDDCGYSASAEHAEECYEARNAIVDRIEATRAEGPAGLAVKARVAQTLMADGNDYDAGRVLASVTAGAA